MPRQVEAHSARLLAARPETVSVDSDAWALRAAQRTQRASSRRQITTIAVNLAVCLDVCTHNKSDVFALEDCFQFADFTAETASGQI